MKLKDLQIRNAKPKEKAYKMADGLGMYVVVMPSGSKVFHWDYRYKGKRKTISLGRYPEVTLEEARQILLEYRKLLRQGIDPSLQRKADKSPEIFHFRTFAEEWFKLKSPQWSQRHAQTVRGRLNNHLYPFLGNRDIREITTEDILNCLKRHQNAKQIETAHRVFQIASQVFRYAIMQGKINFDPCYPIRGFLPSRKPEHHAAPTEPEKLKEILKLVFNYGGSQVVASALKMLAYTFQRPGEVRQAKWKDIDLKAREWRFTASKVGTPHLVPLSRQVVEVLKQLEPLTKPISPYVFPSLRSPQRPLSDAATNAALKALGIDTKSELTSHGFRAVARTLLHEQLNFEPDVIELQLAHRVPDRLGNAYNRTRFLEERKRMMQAWADYLDRLVAS